MALMSTKCGWAECNYYMIMRLCVGLNNFHITCHPLRTTDNTVYVSYNNRLLNIGDGNVRKRRSIQRRYREKRSSTMDVQFRAISNDEKLSATPISSH